MKPLFAIMLSAFFYCQVISQTPTKSKVVRPAATSKQKNIKNSGGAARAAQPLTTKDRIERRLKDSADKTTGSPDASASSQKTVVNGIIISPSSTNSNNSIAVSRKDSNGMQRPVNDINANSQASATLPTANSNTTAGNTFVNNGQNQAVNPGNNQVNINNKSQNGSSNSVATTINAMPLSRSDSVNMQRTDNNINTATTIYQGGVLQPGVTNNSVTGGRPISGEQSQYNTSDMNRSQLNVINQNQNASAAQNTNGANLSQSNPAESQFTPPPAIISTGFGRDYPAIRNATWAMDNNKNYIARYRNGDWWATTSYNVAGIRLETRTEVPLSATLPGPVIMYKGKQTPPVEFSRISRVERAGKPELYEVKLSTGRVIYLNSDGVEVAF